MPPTPRGTECGYLNDSDPVAEDFLVAEEDMIAAILQIARDRVDTDYEQQLRKIIEGFKQATGHEVASISLLDFLERRYQDAPGEVLELAERLQSERMAAEEAAYIQPIKHWWQRK